MAASQLNQPPSKDSDVFDDWLIRFWKLVCGGGTGVNHASLSSLAWTSSGHTGTVSTVAGFDSSGVAVNLTESGSGNVAMTTSPVFTTPNIGAATTALQITSTLATGTAPFSIASTTQVANLKAATCGTADAVVAAGVTFAMFQNLTQFSVFGRSAGGSGVGGNIQASSSGQVLRMDSTATSLGFGAVDLASANACTGALRAGCFPALTGVITTSAGSLTTATGAQTGTGSTFVMQNTPALTTPVVGAATGTSLSVSSFIRSTGKASGDGVGYSTGAGGTQTQLTNKATSVTLNAQCGEITLNNAALAANTTVSFTLSNSSIQATDLLLLNHVTTGTFGAYLLNAHGMASGSCTIDVRNVTAGSLSEAIVIRFAIIKGVTS